MRRDLVAAMRFMVLPTILFVGLAIVAPGRLELGTRIYALLLCATAIVLVLLALRRAYPPETSLREPVDAAVGRRPPPSLGRIEHEVALGVAGSFDLHYRLVPRLRSIAKGLLGSRRKVSLEEQPDASQGILGHDAWELVRPDRRAPQERLARGIPSRDLERVVDALEAI